MTMVLNEAMKIIENAQEWSEDEELVWTAVTYTYYYDFYQLKINARIEKLPSITFSKLS